MSVRNGSRRTAARRSTPEYFGTTVSSFPFHLVLPYGFLHGSVRVPACKAESRRGAPTLSTVQPRAPRLNQWEHTTVAHLAPRLLHCPNVFDSRFIDMRQTFRRVHSFSWFDYGCSVDKVSSGPMNRDPRGRRTAGHPPNSGWSAWSSPSEKGAWPRLSACIAQAGASTILGEISSFLSGLSARSPRRRRAMPPSRVAPKPGEGGCGNPAQRDESVRTLPPSPRLRWTGRVGAEGGPPPSRRRKWLPSRQPRSTAGPKAGRPAPPAERSETGCPPEADGSDPPKAESVNSRGSRPLFGRALGRVRRPG